MPFVLNLTILVGEKLPNTIVLSGRDVCIHFVGTHSCRVGSIEEGDACENEGLMCESVVVIHKEKKSAIQGKSSHPLV